MKKPTFALAFCLLSASAAFAGWEEPTPFHLPHSLKEVGSGSYTKFGLNIYEATLLAPGGTFDRAKAYALKLRYRYELSQDTIAEAVKDNIQEQNIADEETLKRWNVLIHRAMPRVNDGDEMVGVRVPGEPARLYLNGEEIGSIEEPALSDAFFNIWLGEKADASLKSQLLGGGQLMTQNVMPAAGEVEVSDDAHPVGKVVRTDLEDVLEQPAAAEPGPAAEPEPEVVKDEVVAVKEEPKAEKPKAVKKKATVKKKTKGKEAKKAKKSSKKVTKNKKKKDLKKAKKQKKAVKKKKGVKKKAKPAPKPAAAAPPPVEATPAPAEPVAVQPAPAAEPTPPAPQQ